jgi:hypothetical protein
MTVALVVVAAIAVALACLNVLVLRHAAAQLRLVEDSRRLEAESVSAERRELLNRVQAPQFVPQAGPTVAWEIPDAPPDEIDLVGTIQFDEKALEELA